MDGKDGIVKRVLNTRTAGSRQSRIHAARIHAARKTRVRASLLVLISFALVGVLSACDSMLTTLAVKKDGQILSFTHDDPSAVVGTSGEINETTKQIKLTLKSGAPNPFVPNMQVSDGAMVLPLTNAYINAAFPTTGTTVIAYRDFNPASITGMLLTFIAKEPQFKPPVLNLPVTFDMVTPKATEFLVISAAGTIQSYSVTVIEEGGTTYVPPTDANDPGTPGGVTPGGTETPEGTPTDVGNIDKTLIVRVTAAATSDTNNGSTWALATTLRHAVDMVNNAGADYTTREIWLGAGTYPTNSYSLAISANAAIVGGFSTGVPTETTKTISTPSKPGERTAMTTKIAKITSGDLSVAGGYLLVITGQAAVNMEYVTISTQDSVTKVGLGGGISMPDGAKVTLKNGTSVVDNLASGAGGGINMANGSTLTLEVGANIARNTAQKGGGIYAEGSTILMKGGSINGNKAVGGIIPATVAQNLGGGIYIEGEPADVGATKATTLIMKSGATIQSNSSSFAGGGIYMKGAKVTLESGSIVSDNAVVDTIDSTPVTMAGGGGIYAVQSPLGVVPNIEIKGGSVNQNTANSKGGGICLPEGGTLTIGSGSVISGNAVTSAISTVMNFGGGIYVSTGDPSGTAAPPVILPKTPKPVTMTVSAGATISNNKAQNTNATVTTASTNSKGGGIYVYKPVATVVTANLTGAIISGNTTAGNGGGIYVSCATDPALTVTLKDCTIRTNGAIGSGTLALNAAYWNGGGIAIEGKTTPTATATVVLSGTTSVQENVATGVGGGVYFVTTTANAALTLADSAIVYGNVTDPLTNKARFSETPESAAYKANVATVELAAAIANIFAQTFPTAAYTASPIATIPGALYRQRDTAGGTAPVSKANIQTDMLNFSTSIAKMANMLDSPVNAGDPLNNIPPRPPNQAAAALSSLGVLEPLDSQILKALAGTGGILLVTTNDRQLARTAEAGRNAALIAAKINALYINGKFAAYTPADVTSLATNLNALRDAVIATLPNLSAAAKTAVLADGTLNTAIAGAMSLIEADSILTTIDVINCTKFMTTVTAQAKVVVDATAAAIVRALQAELPLGIPAAGIRGSALGKDDGTPTTNSNNSLGRNNDFTSTVNSGSVTGATGAGWNFLY